ncbi:hypothetical protein BsWGS_09349 [Bradybaena similaris]
MNAMDYTMLTFSLGLLLIVTRCAHSEDVFPDTGSSAVEVINSQPLHKAEKWYPIFNSPDKDDNDNTAVEDSDEQVDPAYYADDADKRGGLFRFGKRQGSLFRFGKRQGSLFRFGKRGSLFRFGKRQGSLFRFGKRQGSLFRFGRGAAQDSESDAQLDKRTLFRFGKRADNLPHFLTQVNHLNNPSYLDNPEN